MLVKTIDKNVITSKFAENVLVMRYRKHISQEKLAEMIGISTNHISNIENQRSVPTFPIVVNLCRILEIDLNQFLK